MVSLRSLTKARPKKGQHNVKKTPTQPFNKRRLFTWTRFSMIVVGLLVLDYTITRATARPALTIREGQQHLHNNLVDHAVALDDINSDLEFASVRHLYSTHPNSVILDASKQAEHVARSANETMGIDTVPPTHKLFFGAFTGVALRALGGLAALLSNVLCKFLDDAFGDDKNAGQIVGVTACYIGATLLGLYGLFSAGHNLYKLQQAGERTADIADAANNLFELRDTIQGGISGSKFKRDAPFDVHEMMKDEELTHDLAVAIAKMGYKYEAAGLMSTIRPVSLKTRSNHTAHLWQEMHEGKIRKTHVLTRFNVEVSSADKRQVCEDSNNEEGEDPQATLCSSGDNEGFSGVYDSFDMFSDENSYEVVDYGMGDSKYDDDVARYAGDLMYLGGTSGVCMYPSVNNQTALTILSALEFGGQPSQTYSNCPSL